MAAVNFLSSNGFTTCRMISSTAIATASTNNLPSTQSCRSHVRRRQQAHSSGLCLAADTPQILYSGSRTPPPRRQQYFLFRRQFHGTRKMARLDISNINPHVVEAKYAVRGELAVKSEEYRARLRKGDTSLPFSEVISANIGNPQQLDQKPITFFRQVLSLLENPKLLEHEDVLLNSLGYKPDVLERAKWLLDHCGSVGAYSASAGVPAIKESIARFLEERDGLPADPESIYLSAGASSGVNTLLHIICAAPNTGILVPIPQYPLYTASLSVLNATTVPYYLNEHHNWGTSLENIREAYNTAKSNGTDVRAIVIINPGNPTGASLSEEDVESVLEFAAQEKLVVMADEVYQANVFIGKFHPFRRALLNLQKEHPGKYDNVELASLHSISKGMVGECGHRGGFFELVGFKKEVEEQIYKFVSITLCAPVIGQCLVEMMVNPPKKGDPSFELYDQEYNAILNGLQERATALYEAFNEEEGVECGPPQGSMYLFPTVHVPAKAAEAAKKEGRTPDEFYCMKMLEATGVCVVPGSGFGQVPGTMHFRTTFLAPGTDWVGSLTKFHRAFMEEYGLGLRN
ncbi:PLP-dependent transferase [Xylariaceae sp. FL0662B]|nr:PLP-dependent transferase [Xylariaceae sp. FL0662B]